MRRSRSFSITEGWSARSWLRQSVDIRNRRGRAEACWSHRPSPSTTAAPQQHQRNNHHPGRRQVPPRELGYYDTVATSSHRNRSVDASPALSGHVSFGPAQASGEVVTRRKKLMFYDHPRPIRRVFITFPGKPPLTGCPSWLKSRKNGRRHPRTRCMGFRPVSPAPPRKRIEPESVRVPAPHLFTRKRRRYYEDIAICFFSCCWPLPVQQATPGPRLGPRSRPDATFFPSGVSLAPCAWTPAPTPGTGGSHSACSAWSSRPARRGQGRVEIVPPPSSRQAASP
jgi:hypothetical protein